MSWRFEFTEQSVDQYLCTGLRDSGHTVKAQSSENEIGRVFEFAFDLEIALGTTPSIALFQVTRGAKPAWVSRYDNQSFGSWFVESAESKSQRVVYDGKESCLEVYCGNEQPKWQGAFRNAKDLDNVVFQLLAPASA
jgi:hypothetical protein